MPGPLHSSSGSVPRPRNGCHVGGPENPRPGFSDGGRLEIPPDAPRTLGEAFLAIVDKAPGKGIRFLTSPASGLHLTYRDLLEKALRMRHGLRAAGIRPGDRVVLQIDHLSDHYAAFWACVLGGVVPVTVATPLDYRESNNVTAKLVGVWEQLARPRVLAGDTTAAPLRDLAARRGLDGFHVLPVEQLLEAPPTREFHPGRPGDVAFFQLTSGTTGIPKCIQITHDGVVSHIHSSTQANGHTGDDVLLNWLARDHVVPLLTSHLKGVYLGLEQVELPTETVLADPLAWLDAIAHHRATHTWSPNFGYRLVADRLGRCRDRRWNLSCLKAFMNAGEQVTPAVVRDFLDAVAPFGVAERAMQPAFGMAEVCTCMTYENNFDRRHSMYWLQGDRVTTRGGEAPAEGRAVAVVNLGPPTPGVQIRITDERNQVVPEGTEGRLQIRGSVVTPGYYNHPAANSSAFVGDGWFNTGDLGFIHEGQLAVTGREEERIVIFGANYHCHEIEGAVQSLEGIRQGYVAACAVPDPAAGTDALAVFFSPSQWTEGPPVALISAIRRTIAARIGISTSHIIPVKESAFPRTTSGKIQRGRLVASLEAGAFRDLEKRIDRLVHSHAPPPVPFHRRVWRPEEVPSAAVAPPARPPENACCLVLGRGGRLEQEVREGLDRDGFVIAFVEPGATFTVIGVRHYRVNPGSAQDYRHVLAALHSAGLTVHSVVHLWTHAERWHGAAGIEGLERSQATAAASLLALTQALDQEQGGGATVSLVIVSTGLFSATAGDTIAAEKTPLIGLAGTIPLELPWLSCRVLDLPFSGCETAAHLVRRELMEPTEARSVAFRQGHRLIPRMETVRWREHAPQSLPFRTNGAYVITGGLGGIGKELASHLLQNHQARLLLLGSTPLPDRSRWEARHELPPPVADRIATCLELERRGGELRYESLDVCDLRAVSQAVGRAESAWGCRIEGAVHLAGRYRERLLVDESWEDVWGVIRPKLGGAWVLDQVLRERPGAFVILFSSVFGSLSSAVLLGAYAASNSAVEGFADAMRAWPHRKVWCYAWTNWAGTGMSRGISAAEGRGLRGFLPLTPTAGLQSLLAGLNHDVPDLVIGLDESATCDPPDATGTVRNVSSPVAPETELQRLIADVWCEVLGVTDIGIHEEFRTLGGSSLQVLQIAGRLRAMFSLEVSLRRLLIEGSTVAKAAVLLETLLLQATGDAATETLSPHE